MKSMLFRRIAAAICLTCLCILSFASFGPVPSVAASPSVSCAPVIKSVNKVAATQHQTVGIFGTCFGSHAAYNGDSYDFMILDYPSPSTVGSRHQWSACADNEYSSPDTVTCNITLWTNTEIVFGGFTGAYGQGGNSLQSGDLITIYVNNPQAPGIVSGHCNVHVGSGGPTTC